MAAEPLASVHDIASPDPQDSPIGREALLNALNELLEAERAGARVALASRNGLQDGVLGAFLKELQADEARWCAMLHREIRRLSGVPSRRCGRFCQKAMAIGDLGERLVFLNRGQAWVARRLAGLLPRISDSALYAALEDMRLNHETNIERAESCRRQVSPI